MPDVPARSEAESEQEESRVKPTQPYNPYPYPSRRPDPNAASACTPEQRESQLKRDLLALEKVQAERPMRPPGRAR